MVITVDRETASEESAVYVGRAGHTCRVALHISLSVQERKIHRMKFKLTNLPMSRLTEGKVIIKSELSIIK